MFIRFVSNWLKIKLKVRRTYFARKGLWIVFKVGHQIRNGVHYSISRTNVSKN